MSDHCQTPSYIIRHSYLPPETEYEYKDLLLNDNGSDLIFFKKSEKLYSNTPYPVILIKFYSVSTINNFLEKILNSF